MADYKSIFRVSGNVGDLNMFEKDGKKFIRETTSVDKERIMTDPAYKRVRENMSESAGASQVVSSFRLGLAAIWKSYADNRFHNRLNKAFKDMLRRSLGERGQRPIEISNFKVMLEGMNLDKQSSLVDAFAEPYTLTPSVGRNEVAFDVAIFDADAMVTPPSGATHFKLVMIIMALCDFVYDVDAKKYFPTSTNNNQLFHKVETAPLSVNGMTAAPISLLATLPGAPIMAATDALVTCVGIEFSQRIVSGQYYFLESANAMRIVKVY